MNDLGAITTPDEYPHGLRCMSCNEVIECVVRDVRTHRTHRGLRRMRRVIGWWEDLANHVWIRIDMWLYKRHRRSCEACRAQEATTVGRCHCGRAAVVQHQQRCVPCAEATHPTCWCSVRPELADDINTTK